MRPRPNFSEEIKTLNRVNNRFLLLTSFLHLFPVPDTSHHRPVRLLGLCYVRLRPVLVRFRRPGEETRGLPGRPRRRAAAAGGLPPDAHRPAAAHTAGRVAPPGAAQANHHGSPGDR